MFATATLLVYIVWLFGRIFVPNKTVWRQMCLDKWTWSFVKITGMRLEVVGTPPKPPFFLVTNHLTYADIPALRQAADGIFVAKAEVRSWPVAGPIVAAMGTIFIDRTNRRDIPRAGDQVMERLNAGEGVIVFPEGTSTSGDRIERFNSSFLEFAARCDIPVSYAAVSYSTPPGELPASQVVCWGENISFFAHFWRMTKIKSYTAKITFGSEPVRESDRKVLAQELRDRVEEIFDPVA